jgi:type II secretory pathway component GspD/PulD (secretin)
MKRKLLGIASLSCFFLLPAATWADSGLNDRISLKVTEADPQDVLQTFGKLLKLPAEIDPAIDKPLSLQVEQVTLRTALNAVCESVGCQWRIEGGKLLKVTRLPETPEPERGKGSAALKEKIDIKVTNADARNFFTTVAQIMSGEVSIDPSVKGTLSLDMEAQPLSAILDNACSQVQCRWRVTEGSRPVLEIKPK